jgi:UDP-N-acetylglucosamine 4,6-dehydratase
MSNNLQTSVVTITGGTGPFGSIMLKRLLSLGCGEIRILIRDKNNQDVLRNSIRDERAKVFIKDIKARDSVSKANRGLNYIYHATALKQVSSCEYFPIKATKTNDKRIFNLIHISSRQSVKSVISLRTDKAACLVFPDYSSWTERGEIE